MLPLSSSSPHTVYHNYSQTPQAVAQICFPYAKIYTGHFEAKPFLTVGERVFFIFESLLYKAMMFAVTLPIGRIRRAQRVSGKDRITARPRNQSSYGLEGFACVLKQAFLTGSLWYKDMTDGVEHRSSHNLLI